MPEFAMPRGKRWFDVALAGITVVALAPLWIALAAISRLTIGSPVLYSQERGGIGGSTFRILKLRTMTDERDADGRLLPDDQRKHWWGLLLRKTSLDEIPALLNVLRGDLSLVGPRPLMATYLPRYGPEQAKRHCVHPGLTGLAQTAGRNLLTWEEKFELDLAYVERRSPVLDLRIIFETVAIVLSGKGADGNEHTTEFMGIAPTKKDTEQETRDIASNQ